MLARIRKAEENGEGGFTLIELLVVVIIIGILAAIAIPTFLKQRENGYRAQVTSDLRNAATAAESYAVGNDGSYASMAATDVNTEKSTDVTFDSVGVSANGSNFCIQASHTKLAAGATKFKFLKGDRKPTTGACPGTVPNL